jgi:hypothetical protein
MQPVENKNIAATPNREFDLPALTPRGFFDFVIIMPSLSNYPYIHLKYAASERQLQRKLNLSRIARGGQEPELRRPERRGVDGILRSRLGELQVRMIEDVEEFGTELQVHLLRDMESLERREVPHLVPGPMLHISSQIAE